VRLLNHFEDKEHLILVMEYLEGGSLRGALTGSERMGRGKIEAILR
jgi:serine/threonine protein kinase